MTDPISTSSSFLALVNTFTKNQVGLLVWKIIMLFLVG